LAWRARFTVSPCRGPAGFRSEAASAVASNRDPDPLFDFGVSSRVLTSTVASLDGPPKRPHSRQLSWAFAPFNTCQRRGSTIRGRRHRPLRSAFRVWLPSWRLAPLNAWSGLFHPDSVPGIPPTERSPPGRWDEVSLNAEPACRCDRDLLRCTVAHRPASRRPTTGLWPSPGVP
jgi:hypothetical protein